MKITISVHTAGLLIALIGIMLVTAFSHWAVALGVFLMLWANNLIQGRRDEQEINDKIAIAVGAAFGVLEKHMSNTKT